MTDPKPGHASSPWKMSWQAWRAIATRTWQEAGDDNVGIVAAGVAFYGFLALVPLLGAIVLSYLSCYILIFGAELNSEFEREKQGGGPEARPKETSAKAARLAIPASNPVPPRTDAGAGAGGFATARLTDATMRITGLGKVGLVTSGLSTLGLARIRRGQSGQGLALLGAAGAIAWLRRRPEG